MRTELVDLTRRKIGEQIKIIHISDLHFDRIDTDKKKAFESDLKSIKPDLVVISGDLVDNPWFSNNLRKAKDFVQSLEKHTGRVIIAVGNHERLLRPTNKKFRKRFELESCFCDFIEFRDNRRIAFFVFDSASPQTLFSQRGKISKKQIMDFKECTRKLRNKYVQTYGRSFKIAVLHHHPLPTKRNHYDKLLYLKNSGEFIECLIQENINMVLHGHQHDPVDYSFQWDLGYFDPQPHLLIISAGTLLKDDKNKSGLSKNSNYYLLELRTEHTYGTQFFYNYNIREFMKVKQFRQKNFFRKFYKYNVDLTWEIIAPYYHNRVTRKLTLQAWPGEEIKEFKQLIASTVKVNFNDLNLKIERNHHGEIDDYVVKEEPSPRGDFKYITIPLDPPLHIGDDIITMTYTWPNDFKDDLSGGYTKASYNEGLYIDDFTLRIKPNFNPTECRIWAEDKLVRKPNENNIWEFKMEGVKEMVPINYHITI
jgi:predicted MPP superfamily phosphohydrolase